MSFSILENMLVETGLQIALYDAQSISYRVVSPKEYRDQPIEIGNASHPFDFQNRFYEVLRKNFNKWDSKSVENQLKTVDDLTRAVKSVVHTKGHRRVRRMKKQSNRVYREVNKMWKKGKYGNNEDLRRALTLYHKAYRESFVNLRTKLKKDAYNCIPDNLLISLATRKELVKNLYQYDEMKKAYILDKSKINSSKSIRELQLMIAPYIFPQIFLK